MRSSYERGTFAISLNATNANGAGDEFGFPPYARGLLPFKFSWQVIVSGGTYTARSVILEASLDGTNWYTVDTSSAAGSELRHVIDKPARYLRANKVSSTTGTGTPVVTVGFAA